MPLVRVSAGQCCRPHSTAIDIQYELALVIKQSSHNFFLVRRKSSSGPIAAWAELTCQGRMPPGRWRSYLAVAAAAAAACATCAAAPCAATDNATADEEATAASVRAVAGVQRRPDRRQLAAADGAAAKGMGHVVL